MARKKNGCCDACVIAEDDFSTDTIANYTTVSGSWSVSGGTLSGSGEIVHDNTHTGGEMSVEVTGRVSTMNSIKLIVNYQDSQNYAWVQLDVDQPSTNGGRLRLFEIEGNVTNELGTAVVFEGFTANTFYRLRACLDGNTLYGILKIDDPNGPWRVRKEAISPTLPAGNKGGVGATSSADFDDLSIRKSAVGCPTCRLNCLIHTDYFERSNSSNMGQEWDEGVGNADILNNDADITQPNSVIISEIYDRVPNMDGQNLLASFIVNANEGEARLIGGFNDGVSNDSFWYVQAKVQFAFATITLCHTIGGVTTCYGDSKSVESIELGTEFTLTLCLVPYDNTGGTKGVVLATAKNVVTEEEVFLSVSNIAIPTHSLAGFGSGTGISASGDLFCTSWSGSRTSMDRDLGGCVCDVPPRCEDECADNGGPVSYLLEFSGFAVSGCCAENNESLVVDHAFDCTWLVTEKISESACNTDPTNFTDVLYPDWRSISHLRIEYDAGSDETTVIVRKAVTTIAGAGGTPQASYQEWERVVSGKVNCKDLDEFTLSDRTLIGGCGSGSAIVKVTALI